MQNYIRNNVIVFECIVPKDKNGGGRCDYHQNQVAKDKRKVVRVSATRTEICILLFLEQFEIILRTIEKAVNNNCFLRFIDIEHEKIVPNDRFMVSFFVWQCSNKDKLYSASLLV